MTTSSKMLHAVPPGHAPSGDDAELREPVQWLEQFLGQQATQRIVIGLVGLPGSGKSTLAERLIDLVNRRQGAGTALALGMDGFHLSRAQLARMPDPQLALARRGAPWTFDPQALAHTLRDIRAMPLSTSDMHGLPTPEVRWPGFAHGVGDPVPDALVVPASNRLVLLEGLYLLHRSHGWDLTALLDGCWFLDVDLAPAMERLARRHMASWNMSRIQALSRIGANDLHNARIVMATRSLADRLLPARCAGL